MRYTNPRTHSETDGRTLPKVLYLELSMGWVDPQVGLGWVHYSKSTKNLKGLDKIWFHQAVKFDFTADLTGTGNR